MATYCLMYFNVLNLKDKCPKYTQKEGGTKRKSWPVWRVNARQSLVKVAMWAKQRPA